MGTLTPPRFEGTITVAGGRRLSFAEFGRPHGRAVFWMHGTPGARRQIPEAARVAAEELGVRLVGLDRPGVGSSTAHLYDSFLEFVADLVVAADRLGIDDFAMIGLSGGGPYVLAAAYAIPDRMTAGAILGGVAPTCGPDAPEGGVVSLAAVFHGLLTRLRVPLGLGLSTLLWTLRPFAARALDLYAQMSPHADREILARPEFRAMFLDDLLNGSRLGLRAPVYDVLLFGRPWGFSVRDITVPIRWWHGDADHIIPLAHGQHMVSLIPDCHLHVQPGESHLGTLAEAEAILLELLVAWDEHTARQKPADEVIPTADHTSTSASTRVSE